jgi:hypothetical protein
MYKFRKFMLKNGRKINYMAGLVRKINYLYNSWTGIKMNFWPLVHPCTLIFLGLCMAHYMPPYSSLWFPMAYYSLLWLTMAAKGLL